MSNISGPTSTPPDIERVWPVTTTGDRLLAMSPRMRRFTELWIEERRRQLGLKETAPC